MTNPKCKQCGLVNPFHVLACKRCGASLIAGEDRNATPGTDPQAGTKVSETPGMTETMVPAVCSICGTNGVEIRKIQRTYTPNWVWLFLPLGILPAGIIGLAVQVKHSFSLPICSRCNQRRSLAGVVSWLSIIVCVFLIFVAIGFGIAFKSWFVFLGVCGLIAATAYLAGRYDRAVNPRYTQFTKQRVEIDVPGRGRVVVLDRANPHIKSGAV